MLTRLDLDLPYCWELIWKQCRWRILPWLLGSEYQCRQQQLRNGSRLGCSICSSACQRYVPDGWCRYESHGVSGLWDLRWLQCFHSLQLGRNLASPNDSSLLIQLRNLTFTLSVSLITTMRPVSRSAGKETTSCLSRIWGLKMLMCWVRLRLGSRISSPRTVSMAWGLIVLSRSIMPSFLHSNRLVSAPHEEVLSGVNRVQRGYT